MSKQKELTDHTPTTQKVMSEETKILLTGLEEIEGIIYAVRNKIMQLYGPVNYNIPDIELKFTEQQAGKLTFTDKGTYWEIKTKTFLEPEIFATIANKVRALGGEYVSAGVDSHFKVKKA